MGMRAWAILLAVLAFSGVAGLAAGQVVVLPGTANTGLSGISDDGLRVTGVRTGLGQYYWSQADGFVYTSMPLQAGTPVFISGDGHSFGGTWGGPATPYQSFVTTDTGSTVVLPLTFPGQVNQSIMTSISRDGSVASGWDTHTSSSLQVGWRWSATGGMQVLPGFNFTLSMSGDGRTIFGGNGVGQYGMWRDGVVSPVPDNFGRVQAVNYDASIFAGDGRIWNNGQITTLPLLPGAGNPEIIDMSEDGLVVVGTNALFGGGVVPIVWTPSTGTQPLAAYFASYGYDLSEYRVIDAHVSADGRTFGLATRSLIDNSLRGIIVTVPTPGAACLIVGLIGCAQRRRA
jgi:uncharacterized membrane protein